MGWRWWWAPRGGARREPRDLPSGHHDGGCAPFGHPRMAATSPSRGTRCDPDPPPGWPSQAGPFATPARTATLLGHGGQHRDDAGDRSVPALWAATCRRCGLQRSAAEGSSPAAAVGCSAHRLWKTARGRPTPGFLEGGRGGCGAPFMARHLLPQSRPYRRPPVAGGTIAASSTLGGRRRSLPYVSGWLAGSAAVKAWP